MSMVVAAALLAGGCSAPQVGRPLGYVIDADWSVLRGLGTFWTTAADQADLVRALEGLAAEDLAQRVAGLDLQTELIITVVYDGCTHDDPAEGMTQQEHDRFVRVGTEMAETNGCTPQQSSDLCITDGSVNDGMWAEHEILSFPAETYPSSGGIDGFSPPDEVIERETARNGAAVDVLLREAGA